MNRLIDRLIALGRLFCLLSLASACSPPAAATDAGPQPGGSQSDGGSPVGDGGPPTAADVCLSAHRFVTHIPPAGVRVAFRALDCAGNPLSNPTVRVFDDETGAEIGSSGEGATASEPGVDQTVYLVSLLVLDLSDSIVAGGARDDVVNGALAYVSSALTEAPEIPHFIQVVAFGRPNAYEVIVPFTDDAATLSSGLEGLRTDPGRGTTDLYGAYLTALESAGDYVPPLRGANRGVGERFVVLLTDGVHEAGDTENLRSQALAARERAGVHSLIIGLGGGYDTCVLEELAYNPLAETVQPCRDRATCAGGGPVPGECKGVILGADSATLSGAFDDFAARALALARSYYTVGVCSPLALGFSSLTLRVSTSSGTGQLQYPYTSAATGPVAAGILNGDTASCNAEVVRSTPIVSYSPIHWGTGVGPDSELAYVAGYSCVHVLNQIPSNSYLIDFNPAAREAYVLTVGDLELINLDTGEATFLATVGSILGGRTRSNAGVIGDMLYAVDGVGTLHRWDISDRSSPTPLPGVSFPGSLPLSGYLGFAMSEDWAMGATFPGIGSHTLYRVDLRSDPTVVYELDYPNIAWPQPVDRIRIQGDVAVYPTDRGIFAVNLADGTAAYPPVAMSGYASLQWVGPGLLFVATELPPALYLINYAQVPDVKLCPLNTVCGDGVCSGREEVGTCSEDCFPPALDYCICNRDPSAVEVADCVESVSGDQFVVPFALEGLEGYVPSDMVVDGDRVYIQFETTVPWPFRDCVFNCGGESVIAVFDVSNPQNPEVIGLLPGPEDRTAGDDGPRFFVPEEGRLLSVAGLMAYDAYPLAARDGVLYTRWAPGPARQRTLLLDVSNPWCGLTPP